MAPDGLEALQGIVGEVGPLVLGVQGILHRPITIVGIAGGSGFRHGDTGQATGSHVVVEGAHLGVAAAHHCGCYELPAHVVGRGSLGPLPGLLIAAICLSRDWGMCILLPRFNLEI